MSVLNEARVQRQATLAEQAYDILCRSIIAGDLGPGDRLILDQLAPRLGVSLTPIREAVIRLVQDGLAAEDPDGKLRVVPLTPQYVTEIFGVRGALEGLSAELAVPRLTERDHAEFRVLLEGGSRGLAAGDVRAYHAGGGPFHQRIIDAAGNLTLVRELRSLRTHVAYILGYSQRRMGDHLVHAQEEHWELLDALVRRDPVAARQVSERHVRASGTRIAALLAADRAHGSGREA